MVSPNLGSVEHGQVELANTIGLGDRLYPGITFSIGSNAIRNAGTVECPISGSEAFTSIPMQILGE